MRNFLLSIVLMFSSVAFAAELSFPTLNRPVIDMVGLLTEESQASLSSQIKQIYEAKGPQIGILVTNDLQGYPIEEYSIRLAERWQLGGAKSDNGLIVVIAPSERKMRIEVGGGVEGEITDLVASRLISDVLRPAFKAEDYAGGLQQVLIVVAERFDIKLNGAGGVRRQKRVRTDISPGTLIFLIFLFVILGPLLRRSRGGFYGYSSSRSGWGGSSHSGGWSSGGGGWGGGGGGFSGGGASGDW